MAEEKIRLDKRDLNRLEKAADDIEGTSAKSVERAERLQQVGERALRVIETAERILPRIERFTQAQISAGTTRDLKRGAETARGAVAAAATTLAVTRSPKLAAVAFVAGGALGFTEQERRAEIEKFRQRQGLREIQQQKIINRERNFAQRRRAEIEAMRERIRQGR